MEWRVRVYARAMASRRTRRDDVTRQEARKRQRRHHAIAAACGDAVRVSIVPAEGGERQRAVERHQSTAHPAWDMYAALRRMPTQRRANPAFRPSVPLVNNVVATARCVNAVPSAARIAWSMCGSRQRADASQPVHVTVRNVGVNIDVQPHTGKMNLTAGKSPSAVLLAVLAYMTTSAREWGVPLTLVGVGISNRQATWNVGGAIDTAALVRATPQANRTELISSVSVTIKEPRVTVLVWHTGSLVVNGCHTHADHRRVARDFGAYLERFVTPGARGVVASVRADAPVVRDALWADT